MRTIQTIFLCVTAGFLVFGVVMNILYALTKGGK